MPNDVKVNIYHPPTHEEEIMDELVRVVEAFDFVGKATVVRSGYKYGGESYLFEVHVWVNCRVDTGTNWRIMRVVERHFYVAWGINISPSVSIKGEFDGLS